MEKTYQLYRVTYYTEAPPKEMCCRDSNEAYVLAFDVMQAVEILLEQVDDIYTKGPASVSSIDCVTSTVLMQSIL